MKTASNKELIGVADLRVGMFVHLDMGWMAHPFPLGNFKVSSAEQIVQIRALGLQYVRWSPDHSDLRTAGESGESAQAGEPAACNADASAGISAPQVPAPPPDPDHGTVRAATVDTPSAMAAPATHARPRALDAGSAAAAASHPSAAAMGPLERQLAEQHAALQICERQFAEAARDCRRLTDLVRSQPRAAGEQAAQLSRALLGKMLGEQELCVRLLTSAAGDKASAHALNVTIVSLLMGRSFGLADDEMLDLGVGALLHDIGKIDLPDRVRHREDHLSTVELRFHEEHVGYGVDHARRMGLSLGATLVIAQHHEQADGAGYPLHLDADRITTAARIVALVNRYDNLCNPGVPSKALTPHESLAQLFAQGKSQFDTTILSAFIRMMGVYPAGSTVQLTDDRYAIVVGASSTRPLKPRVLVYDSAVPRDEAMIVNLESAGGIGIRRSIRPQQLPAAVLEYLAPSARVAYFFEPVGVRPDDAMAA